MHCVAQSVLFIINLFLYILTTPFLCILFCSSLSVHCVLHFVLLPIVCGHLFFSAFALSSFSLQVPPVSGYRPVPAFLPYLSLACVKVSYVCPRAPAEFLSHWIISDNPSELLPVPFFVTSCSFFFWNLLFQLFLSLVSSFTYATITPILFFISMSNCLIFLFW